MVEVLRQVVESQIVASVGYDRKTQLLEVEFRNGWIYEYEDGPAAVHAEFMADASHGGYLKRLIADRYVTRRTT